MRASASRDERAGTARGVALRLGLTIALVAGSSRADPSVNCPPWCPDPKARPVKVSATAKGRWRPGFAMRALSLYGSVDRTRLDLPSGIRDGSAASVGIEERSIAYLNAGWISARYLDFFSIGGGRWGMTGGLGADLAVGIWPVVAGRRGPLVRLGVRGHWLSEQRTYSSLLELPQLQLGWAFVSNGIHFEVAPRAGFVLAGRFAVPDAEPRKLGASGELGGYVALGWNPIHLDVDLSRIERRGDRLGPLDQLEARLCGAIGKPIFCAHAGVANTREYAGVSPPNEIPSRNGADAFARTVGITVGLGPVERR